MASLSARRRANMQVFKIMGGLRRSEEQDPETPSSDKSPQHFGRSVSIHQIAKTLVARKSSKINSQNPAESSDNANAANSEQVASLLNAPSPSLLRTHRTETSVCRGWATSVFECTEAKVQHCCCACGMGCSVQQRGPQSEEHALLAVRSRLECPQIGRSRPTTWRYSDQSQLGQRRVMEN